MTNASIHFCENDGTSEAIIYVHGDGYPEGAGKDLETFLKEVQKHVPDNRFHCPHYLAAKFVVWQAKQIRKDNKSNHYLDFLSLGIMPQDAGDISYRYKIICNGIEGKALPKIITEKV